MGRRTRAAEPEQPEQPEQDGDEFPSAADRKGMRGHDDDGNVRPADGRWGLHEPAEESDAVRTGGPGSTD